MALLRDSAPKESPKKRPGRSAENKGSGLYWVGLLAAVVAGAGALVRPQEPRVVHVTNSSTASSATPSSATPQAPCPRGMLPDNGVCIPVPKPKPAAAQEPAVEGIPLLPNRSQNYGDYRLPVLGAAAQISAPVSDNNRPFTLVLDAPAESQAVVAALSEQTASPSVLALDGVLGFVVAEHRVPHAAGGTERYLLKYENLVQLNSALALGAALPPGTPLGTLRTLETGQARLVLSAFRVRKTSPADLNSIPLQRLLGPAHSIPCDPRNVLALREPGSLPTSTP